jgi:hypothetical protein
VNVVTRDDLRYLIDRSGSACVSIFMPTHRLGRERKQDPIRLKNLLGKAEDQLRATGLTALEAQSILDPATSLIPDSGFWRLQYDGLAIFLSQGLYRFYQLPLNFDELLVVADSFHIKPLLPMLSGDGRFYILAISMDRVRLLQGTRYSVNEIDPQGMPMGMAQALRFDDPERQLQYHTGTQPTSTGGERPAVYHGHGAGNNDQKTNILRYFYKVDDGMRNIFQDEKVPLILAGVDYLLPIYHQANSYQHLVEQGITGNPDEIHAEELHQKAWNIVQPIFQQEWHDEVESYHARAGANAGETSTDLEEVLRAAFLGQVSTLFTALGTQHWGIFDPYDDKMVEYDQYQPEARDLLDFAAAHTLINRGTVYAISPEHVPSGGHVAAIFRYSLFT